MILQIELMLPVKLNSMPLKVVIKNEFKNDTEIDVHEKLKWKNCKKLESITISCTNASSS